MPTFAHGKNVNVFINEYDFSTYFNDVSATITVLGKRECCSKE